MKERANLGFEDELTGFDPADWTPKPAARKKTPPESRTASRELAEATGFRSREPVKPAPEDKPKKAGKAAKTAAKPVRRRRTGRNAQFNIKTKPETIEAFCAIADANGWGLGETFEHAVTLLQADLTKS
ncbi:hypothetical protein ACN2XU_02950 [Primorskyibacter sp. 2E107]|uniref:hypothetical protein n=1 Tax=Primorskyibacter sp. 2E107 TaxID=3403458 RepID=UPI003AF87CD5